MPRAVDRVAHGVHTARHSGRRLVVHDADGLDRVWDRRRAAPRRPRWTRHAASLPAGIRRRDPDAGRACPQVAKCPVSAISTRSPGERVLSEGRFRAPVPDARVDDDRAVGLENRLHAGENRLAERRELGSAVVDRRCVDRAQYPDPARWSDPESAGNSGRSMVLRAVSSGAAEAPARCSGPAATIIGTSCWRLLAHAGRPRPSGGPCILYNPRMTLAARLSRAVEGEVLFDAGSRGRYATNTSIYEVMPVGVLVPEDVGRRPCGDRDLPRCARADPAARGRQLAVRPDGRRRAGDRSRRAPRPDRRFRSQPR